MNQELAKRILDSDLLDKVADKVRMKLYKSFCTKTDYDNVYKLHEYAVVTEDVIKEITYLLTNIANQGKVK